MSTSTTYEKIDPATATDSDEFLLNGTWHRAKSVHHLSGGRIVVIWPAGGRMAGPVHHLAGRVRRAVPATTWHGMPATLAASDSPALPWIVTLPDGHPDLGYAPGSQFLTDAEGLRAAQDDDQPDPRDVIDRAAEDHYRAHSSSITGIYEAWE